MANPRRRRDAGAATTWCVGWHSSTPLLYSLPHDTAEPRQRTCFRRQGSLRRRHRPIQSSAPNLFLTAYITPGELNLSQLEFSSPGGICHDQSTQKHRHKEPKNRCAIYTRKSCEEGLELEFNSLHAQRESAEAFIASQQHEGWECLPVASRQTSSRSWSKIGSVICILSSTSTV